MTSTKYPVASFTNSRLQVQVGRLELSDGLSLVVLLPRGPLGALETLERSLDPPTFLALLRRAAQTPPRATALALPRMHLDLTLDVVPLVHDMDEMQTNHGSPAHVTRAPHVIRERHVTRAPRAPAVASL
ncbi:plasma protease C1 inhibitor [Manacus vitellinus]|uniref:plasma protease C1 inhibitor n=1 Tax=Manacus vitellinus TaxID=328815 RepID=UPI00115EF3F8|nr:plasma protease C1 inhibitor [Manacus vitellinus]